MKLERDIEILNKLGIHARPAAKIVRLARDYQSTIQLVKDNEVVDGKSILEILMLAAGKGSIIKIIVEGDDAEEALEALTKLISTKFNED
jgi:phosphocarrier protein